MICWGFWEGSHWKPRAAFWDRDWNVRPNGRVWLDLFDREWTTDLTLSTDATGRCSCRAFKGRLCVIVDEGDRHGENFTDLDAAAAVQVAID